MYNEVMENTDFVIEHIDKEVKVITDRPSSVVNYPANTDFFIENIDDNVISIAHSLNIEASEVEFRPANTDFFIENIDNNVIMIAESLELIPSEVTIRPANTDFFVENIDKNLIAIAEYYDLEPSRVVLRPANTDMFIENIDRNVTLIKSRTNVITKSGSFINVDVPDGGTMQLTAINGNATQDGTPTPDTPVPISTVTGENTVKVEGKNLFSGDFSQFDDQGGAGTLYTYFELPTDGDYMLTLVAKNEISTQSTSRFIGFSSTGGGAPGGRILWAYSGTASSTAGQTRSIPNYVAGGGKLKYMTLYPKNQATLEWFTENFDIQLELGSTATTYEPYQGQEFTIDLGSNELCEIGTYQDYIWNDGGTWKIHKAVGKATVSLGTTVYTLSGGLKGATYAPAGKVNDAGGALCDKATPWPGGEAALWNGCYYENPSNFMFVGSADDTSTTLKAKYDGATLYYVLATPTTTEITDETLLEQLNFVADMYEGINNISFIGTGAQGSIEVVINKD